MKTSWNCMYARTQGMPLYDNETKRGDMWVLYSVSFPKNLSAEQKQSVKSLFSGVAMA